MDVDTDLFVQGFWVRCRETVRPELDHVVDTLKSQGHEAHVSSQEYSAVPDGLPEAGPSLILTVHLHGAAEGRVLRFHGDVATKTVAVTASPGGSHRHELSDLELPVVKREVADWLAQLLARPA